MIDDEDCSHIWRPYWEGDHISFYLCDLCYEYREEDFYDDED